MFRLQTFLLFLPFVLIGIVCGQLNRCFLPVSEGTCNEHLQRWYYSNATGTCSRFIYRGCGGNDNNFNSTMYCEIACNSSTDAGTLAHYGFNAGAKDRKGVNTGANSVPDTRSAAPNGRVDATSSDLSGRTGAVPGDSSKRNSSPSDVISGGSGRSRGESNDATSGGSGRGKGDRASRIATTKTPQLLPGSASSNGTGRRSRTSNSRVPHADNVPAGQPAVPAQDSSAQSTQGAGSRFPQGGPPQVQRDVQPPFAPGSEPGSSLPGHQGGLQPNLPVSDPAFPASVVQGGGQPPVVPQAAPPTLQHALPSSAASNSADSTAGSAGPNLASPGASSNTSARSGQGRRTSGSVDGQTGSRIVNSEQPTTADDNKHDEEDDDDNEDDTAQAVTTKRRRQAQTTPFPPPVQQSGAEETTSTGDRPTDTSTGNTTSSRRRQPRHASETDPTHQHASSETDRLHRQTPESVVEGDPLYVHGKPGHSSEQVIKVSGGQGGQVMRHTKPIEAADIKLTDIEDENEEDGLLVISDAVRKISEHPGYVFEQPKDAHHEDLDALHEMIAQSDIFLMKIHESNDTHDSEHDPSGTPVLHKLQKTEEKRNEKPRKKGVFPLRLRRRKAKGPAKQERRFLFGTANSALSDAPVASSTVAKSIPSHYMKQSNQREQAVAEYPKPIQAKNSSPFHSKNFEHKGRSNDIRTSASSSESPAIQRHKAKTSQQHGGLNIVQSDKSTAHNTTTGKKIVVNGTVITIDKRANVYELDHAAWAAYGKKTENGGNDTEDEVHVVSDHVQNIIVDPTFTFTCHNITNEDKMALHEAIAQADVVGALRHVVNPTAATSAETSDGSETSKTHSPVIVRRAKKRKSGKRRGSAATTTVGVPKEDKNTVNHDAAATAK